MLIILLFLGGLGATEVLVIAAVILLFFGGKKIPEMFRGVGKGLREFKDAQKDTDEPPANENEVPKPPKSPVP